MKDSFLFHLENAEDLEGLTDAEMAAIFRGMIQYQSTGKEPEFEDRLLRAVWKPIRRRMDADNNAYEAKCEANRENAKKGGAPKGNQNAKKNNPTVEKTTQTTEGLKKQPKQPDSDTDTDTDTDIQKNKPTNVGLQKKDAFIDHLARGDPRKAVAIQEYLAERKQS